MVDYVCQTSNRADSDYMWYSRATRYMNSFVYMQDVHLVAKPCMPTPPIYITNPYIFRRLTCWSFSQGKERSHELAATGLNLGIACQSPPPQDMNATSTAAGSAGLRAQNYDIILRPDRNNILDTMGYLCAIRDTMRLAPSGVLFSGVPCSSHPSCNDQ